MQIADIISIAPSSTPGQTPGFDGDEAAFLRHLDDFQAPGLEVDRESRGWPNSHDDQGKTQVAVREPRGADPDPIADPVGDDEPAVEPTDDGAQPGDNVDAPETQNTQESETGAQDGPGADHKNAEPGDDAEQPDTGQLATGDGETDAPANTTNPSQSKKTTASAHGKPTGASPALAASEGLEVAQAKAGDNVPGHTPVAAAKAAADPAVAATPQVANAGAAKNVGNAAGVPAAPDHGTDPDALLAAIALGAIGSSAAKAVGDGSTGGAVTKTAMVNPAGERAAADGEPNKATVQNSQSAKAAGAHHNPGKGTGNPGAGNGNANSGGNGQQTAANFGGEQTTQSRTQHQRKYKCRPDCHGPGVRC